MNILKSIAAATCVTALAASPAVGQTLGGSLSLTGSTSTTTTTSTTSTTSTSTTPTTSTTTAAPAPAPAAAPAAAPAPTVTNVTASFGGSAKNNEHAKDQLVMTGTITGDVLTVTSITHGHLEVGTPLSATNIPTGTKIKEFITGNGGAGTYKLNNSVN